MRRKILIAVVGLAVVLGGLVLWNYMQLKDQARRRGEEIHQSKLAERCDMHRIQGVIRPDLPGVCERVIQCANEAEEACVGLAKDKAFRDCTEPCLAEGLCRLHRKDCHAVDDFLCSLSKACRDEGRCHHGYDGDTPGGVCVAKP